ncbi:MAG TPA: GNAT family N-acetyltransferase [Casimicrobiaceae bacterium]
MASSDVVIAAESPRAADVVALVRDLDAYQGALYPPASNHFLDVDALAASDVRFVVARREGVAVGCGALRVCDGYGELKRMYVHPAERGNGIGVRILAALESIAREEALPVLRLETGIAQPEALALYAAAGFSDCAPFGEYQPDVLSRFMHKRLVAR